MRGRKKSLALVVSNTGAAGTQRKCPSAPSWLSTAAKAEWRRAAPDLLERGLLENATVAMLEAYCIAAGTVRELEAVMAEEGRTILVDGKVKTHPAFRMQGAAMREARLLAAELGLTPHRRDAAPPAASAPDEGWDDDLLA